MLNSREDIRIALDKYLVREGAERFELRAALVDMDGVLYDSMPRHAAAWKKMMKDLGIECDENMFYLYEGMTGKATIAKILRDRGLAEVSDDEAMKLYAVKSKYFSESGEPDVMPITHDILTHLKGRGIECVLVTGSGQQSVLNRIDRDYNGIFAADKRVTAHNVTHGKPAPDPYVKGMDMAGVQPWQSLVIENAPLGIQSGRAAGCFVVGVTTGPVPEEDMWDAGADLIFPTMSEFNRLLPDILEILS